jgi:hypothetical protein
MLTGFESTVFPFHLNTAFIISYTNTKLYQNLTASASLFTISTKRKIIINTAHI